MNKTPSDPIPSQPDEVEAIARLEPVAWQYLHHDPLSGHPLWLEKSSWNGHHANQSRSLYTRAQLEAHAAEQVRAERESIAAWHDEQAQNAANASENIDRYSDDTEKRQAWRALKDREDRHRSYAAAIRARGQV